LIDNLKKPYPYNSIQRSGIIALLIGLFVFLFLFVFKPFGLNEMESHRLARASFTFGFISFICTAAVFILPRLLLPKYFNEDNWMVYKETTSIVIILLLVSVANYVYAAKAGFITFSTIDFLSMLIWTLAIGVIIVFTLVSIKTNQALKKHLDQAQKMNHTIKDRKILSTSEDQNPSILLSSEIEKQSIKVNPFHLLYITSVGNYLECHYLDEAGQPQSGKIRNRMKSMEEFLMDYPIFFRCHRAFIINKNFIESVEGNTKGYVLSLKHLDIAIPVARSKSAKLKTILS